MDYKELTKSLLCNGYGAGEDADGCANKKCKYRDADGACDLTRMCGDAAIAINELLVENQASRNAANGFKQRLEAAESRAEKAERERDAAIKDMKQNTKCYICKHYPEDNVIAHCKLFRECGLAYANWEWRGLKEE